MALVIATVFLCKQAHLLRESMAAHTALGGWVGRLQRVSLSLGEAESAQRGYLLTGKGEYLTPYQRAVTTLPATLGTLDNIPIADPQLGVLVSDIRRQSDLKLTELGRTINLYQQGRPAAAIALVQSDSGEHFMEQVRADAAKAIDIVMANRSALNERVDSGASRLTWPRSPRAARALRLRFFILTSTGSNPSTTPTGTRPETRCYASSRCVCIAWCGPPMRSRGWGGRRVRGRTVRYPGDQKRDRGG